jgi:hypothetical protein
MTWDAKFYNFSALVDVLIWLVYDHKTKLWKEYCTTFKIIEVAALVGGSPVGCFPLVADWQPNLKVSYYPMIPTYAGKRVRKLDLVKEKINDLESVDLFTKTENKPIL